MPLSYSLSLLTFPTFHSWQYFWLDIQQSNIRETVPGTSKMLTTIVCFSVDEFHLRGRKKTFRVYWIPMAWSLIWRTRSSSANSRSSSIWLFLFSLMIAVAISFSRARSAFSVAFVNNLENLTRGWCLISRRTSRLCSILLIMFRFQSFHRSCAPI